MKKVLLAFLFAVVGLLASRTAEASHFRFGTINWKVPDPQNAPMTVQFLVQVAWRADYPIVDTTILNFGDGTTNPATAGALIGSGADAAGEAYNLHEYTTTHTYAGAGPFTAFFESCCRVSTVVNGADDNFRVQSVVSLDPGNTSGPVSFAPAIVHMQLGGIRTYTLATFDQDFDVVSCRFATAGETGMLPGNEIPKVPNGGAQPTLSGACTITWDLTLAVVNQKYVVHIIMESSHNGGPVSTTAVDLLVEITNVPPPLCVAVPPGPYVAPVGSNFMATVTGTNPALGNLTVTTQNAPVGSTLSPASGTNQVSPFPATFSWTPTAADVGTTIVLVNYTTAQNITGTCSLVIQVPQCVGFGMPCQAAGEMGECVNGTTVCSGVGMTTCAPGAPAPETCDAKDNDCDGMVDDSTIDSGVACPSGSPGVCAAGTTTCVMGNVNCVATIMPGSQMELCNDQDDDCDGAIDNGFMVGQMCSVGQGECASTGIFLCAQNGTQMCNAVPLEPTVEICDAKDNDCNGMVDDGNIAGTGVVCATGLSGVCATGMTSCSAAGAIECTADVMPGSTMESCNLLDDDCDGETDEDFMLGEACTAGVGACEATGMFVCDLNSGMAVCSAMPGMPTMELCDDNIDSDCDGTPSNGCNFDADGDGLLDDFEISIGTNPNDADSDDDGVIDGMEPKLEEDTDGDGDINALDPDSDGDGLKDGTELGLDCSNMATDGGAGNCIPDGDKGTTKTDPLDPDTDDGSVFDGEEDTDHDGVVDAGERDPNVGSDDVPPSCTTDSDCGGPTSGKVCNNSNTCQDGCRGTGGNGCPETLECSSQDSTIGTCGPSDEEEPYFGEGSGLCAVQQPGNDNSSSSAAWLLGLVALARVVSRRRKAG